jgi:hypothetical protein
VITAPAGVLDRRTFVTHRVTDCGSAPRVWLWCERCRHHAPLGLFERAEDQTFVPTKQLREVEIERALRLLRQGTAGLL